MKHVDNSEENMHMLTSGLKGLNNEKQVWNHFNLKFVFNYNISIIHMGWNQDKYFGYVSNVQN